MFEDFDTSNGDQVHDDWVDSDYYENTGNSNVFDELDFGNFIDNLNYWD